MARSTKYTNRKMSNALVKDITNKLMRHRFTPLLVAAWARDYALVTLVYEARYTLQHRLAMAQMEDTYPGSFSKVATFYCQVQQGLSLHVGSVTNNTCRVDGLSQYFLLNEGLIERPPSFLVPSQHNERIRLNDIKPELDEAVFNFVNEHRALAADITKAEAEAYAAVRGFGTARMLVQGWPEIEPLAKDLLPRAGSNVAPAQMLPAVRIAEMNAAFHLPPEEVVAHNMLGAVNTVIGAPLAATDAEKQAYALTLPEDTTPEAERLWGLSKPGTRGWYWHIEAIVNRLREEGGNPNWNEVNAHEAMHYELLSKGAYETEA